MRAAQHCWLLPARCPPTMMTPRPRLRHQLLLLLRPSPLPHPLLRHPLQPRFRWPRRPWLLRPRTRLYWRRRALGRRWTMLSRLAVRRCLPLQAQLPLLPRMKMMRLRRRRRLPSRRQPLLLLPVRLLHRLLRSQRHCRRLSLFRRPSPWPLLLRPRLRLRLSPHPPLRPSLCQLLLRSCRRRPMRLLRVPRPSRLQ
jgi:hypothetical protein